MTHPHHSRLIFNEHSCVKIFMFNMNEFSPTLRSLQLDTMVHQGLSMSQRTPTAPSDHCSAIGSLGFSAFLARDCRKDIFAWQKPKIAFGPEFQLANMVLPERGRGG